MRKIVLGIWQKSITGGGLPPLGYFFGGQGAKGQGWRQLLVLPLSLCELTAISRSKARALWSPGASCSYTSCCPTGPGNMLQLGTGQHQSRVSIRECANHFGSAPDLIAHPLDYIVGSDLRPVRGRKAAVDQHFLDNGRD